MATIDVTESTFGEVIESNPIVFVDFWAAWCGPCRGFAPVYEAVSADHPDAVFAKVDTEAEQALAAAANITSIPTLMAFRDKVLVYSEPGALSRTDFADLVEAVKAIDMKDVHARIAAEEQARKGVQPPGAEA
ncbi:thioredoxin family protein [Galactobacter valiniphilus]|uniref:Thioredoxin n=1 Tax=Galactobacter valiniphilus TaxID=2676122 RepID=A0A399JDQ7_9MICC|nr:thioredoxin family protein [Galactobacter valiniphilus]RII43678.1 thioredoxin [Galactobacter valiniphilus]